MTEEEKNQLSVFEAKLRQLMFLHDELKEKNRFLVEALGQNWIPDMPALFTDNFSVDLVCIIVPSLR